MDSFQKLLDSLPENYTPGDRELIKRAYRLAEKSHHGQKRASGEPYLNHCIAVAIILADLKVPPDVVVAGLLHDIVEDTDVQLDDLANQFSPEIAKLVDGVTKLTQLPRVSRGDQHFGEEEEELESKKIAKRRGRLNPEEEAENASKQRRYDLVSETLRKTFLAMGEDIRVVLIKLADRLHNMRTLGHVPEAKRRRIAKETSEIFAPLANRLGIWQIKWELEDLAFRYLDPESYKEIAEKLAERRVSREGELEQIICSLEKKLSNAGIKAEITGRPKHLYSISRKMQAKGVPFELVHDVRGVRILVDSIPECYTSLGIIHTHWRPIPGEFDDYIASPKDNFYQSLHTAVKYEDGKDLEFQIRTREMHQNAEYGIAAHWRYKEGLAQDGDYERRINWLKQMMDWRQEVTDAGEFVDGMKSDVFEDRVYIFTPRGDIIDLPLGSTAIDFAYHVHTDIGHRCRGAKINGKLVALDYKLQTGDQVEVLTSKRGGPSRDWLNPNLGLVKTQRAKSKIRRWFKYLNHQQNVSHGKAILDREMKRLALTEIKLDQLVEQFELKSVDDLYFALGCGDISLGKIINQLMKSEKAEDGLDFSSTRQIPPGFSPGDGIMVLGLKGLLTHMALCCQPAPGDDIIGYITRGRGATVHRRDCPNILRLREQERLVKVSWGEPKDGYPVAIRIKAYDRDGLMRDISTLISNEGINMGQMKVDVKQNLAVFDLMLSVKDISQLSLVLTRLENLPNVMFANRMRPG